MIGASGGVRKKGADIPIIPYFHKIITSTSHKSSELTSTRAGAYDGPRSCGWSPADGVYAHAMSMEYLMRPAVITEFQDANVSVGRSAGKQATAFVWSPRYHVHGSCVEGEIEYPAPGRSRGSACSGALFTPYNHFAVVGRGRQYCTVFWMCLCSPSMVRPLRAPYRCNRYGGNN